jgi:hypothetical protein
MNQYDDIEPSCRLVDALCMPQPCCTVGTGEDLFQPPLTILEPDQKLADPICGLFYFLLNAWSLIPIVSIDILLGPGDAHFRKHKADCNEYDLSKEAQVALKSWLLKGGYLCGFYLDPPVQRIVRWLRCVKDQDAEHTNYCEEHGYYSNYKDKCHLCSMCHICGQTDDFYHNYPYPGIEEDTCVLNWDLHTALEVLYLNDDAFEFPRED